MKRNKTVSLCMIVKNEEQFLSKCLNSVKDFVDEMVIVDTGSTDNTIAIAKSFGVNLYHYEWNNSFSHARNYSLEKCTMDWILLMDGDDEFNTEHADKLINLINTSDKDGHFFKTLSYAGEESSKTIVSNINLRLLKNNKKYEYAGAIHEQLTCINGKMDYNNFSTEDIHVFHYGYLTAVSQKKDKRTRNIDLIQEELKKDPTNSFHLFNLGNEYFALNDLEKALSYFDQVYPRLNYDVGYASKLIIRRIMCFDELGRYKDALLAIQEALKHYPKFTDLEFLRGWIHLKQRHFTLAINSFNTCLDLGPPPLQLEFIEGCGTYRSLEGLGEIYFKLEDYNKAFHYFEQTLRENPYSQQAFFKLGACLKQLYTDKHYIAYKLSEYVDLNHVPNLLLVSHVLLKEGLYDLAEGYLQKATDLDKDNSQIQLSLGMSLFYQQKYLDAVSSFQQIDALDIYFIDTLKFTFIHYLIIDNNTEMPSLLDTIKDQNLLLHKCCLQLYTIFEDKADIIFLDTDNHHEILTLAISLLEITLKCQEFDLFEKLLNVLNYIEDDNILMELAKLYYHNNFNQLAVQEVLRSIKLFDKIDAYCAEILYKTTL